MSTEIGVIVTVGEVGDAPFVKVLRTETIALHGGDAESQGLEVMRKLPALVDGARDEAVRQSDHLLRLSKGAKP